MVLVDALYIIYYILSKRNLIRRKNVYLMLAPAYSNISKIHFYIEVSMFISHQVLSNKHYHEIFSDNRMGRKSFVH